ncbi:MAG TPA: HIT family protein [Ignavibacteriaceae bacterium]|jgi:histidine triad (HIT) family protein|nr:HIT family protein [Ignavibacteriaceae bacterium]
MNCIFCRIIEKQSKAEILYEDEKVISFLDVNPLNYGHALVVPKIHCETFLDIPEEYIPGMFMAVQKVTAGIVKAIDIEGYNILSNNGRRAGQSVFHCHFHIIPRYNNDGHKFRMNFKKYSNNGMKEIAEKIKDCIDNNKEN